jgi:hypothetical protein
MNYNKPEIVPMGPAVLAIQGHAAGSKAGLVGDGQGADKFITCCAYEADE